MPAPDQLLRIAAIAQRKWASRWHALVRKFSSLLRRASFWLLLVSVSFRCPARRKWASV